MSVRPEHRELLGSAILAILLTSFFLTPLLILIPHVSGESEGWWDVSWPYRKAITINQTRVGETLENFPMLINVTDRDLSKAQQDGDDIAFVDASTDMKLNHEIEYFNRDTGDLVAWVSIPLLTNTTDTKLFIYYGNPAANNQQSPTTVWDSNHVMVQHLEENSGTRYDSTGNRNDGTPYKGVSKSPLGKIDGADAFDGVDDHVRQTTLNLLDKNEVMIETWIYVDSVPAVARWAKTHMYGRYLSSPLYWYGLWIGLPNTSPTNRFVMQVRLHNPGTATVQDSSQNVFLVDQWVHVAWGLSRLTNRTYFYVNGVLVKSDDIAALLATGFITPLEDPAVKGFSIGSNILWQECMKIRSDEVRISTIVRSAGWILTSYNNQNDPSTFCTIGEEERIQESPPFISDENPRNETTDVYTNPTLSVRATDVDGDSMTIVFSTNATGTWQDVRSYTDVGDGTYEWTPATMNQLGTKYYWSVCATDGTTWTNKTYSFTTTITILKNKWTRWGTSVPSSVSGVLIADVNGDGLEEVFHAGNGGVVALRGTDGSVIWNVSLGDIGTNSQAQMADLNRDGVLEIIVPQISGITVLNANDGSKYWSKNLPGEQLGSPVIADIDGNGYPTIFAASAFNALYSQGRLTALSYDGRILYQTYTWHPCDGGLSIADTDNDGEFELYMGDRDMYYQSDTDYGKGIRSFWARNLTERWNHPDVLASSNIPMLADVDKDGRLDVIAGFQRGGIVVLNSTDGSAIKKQFYIYGSDDKLLPIHYQPSIYDIDGDGNLELLMADGTHDWSSIDVVVWDLVQWKEDARISVGQAVYGPQVADVTGDGIMDIIIANYTGIFVFDKTYSLIAQATGLSGRLNYAVAQDIDGDGYNEVVVSSLGREIYAFDTPARRPTPRARSEVQFYSERRLGVAEYVPPPGCPTPVISAPSPLDGATNVPVTLSHLSFNITDFQYDLMNYTVITTPNINSDSTIKVRSGRYTLPVTDLEYDTTYTWVVSVTDGTHWTDKTYTFTTESEPTWWNTSWQYRKTIAVDPARVTLDQNNFPVLIDVTDSVLTEKARSDGYDFVFTDANQNKLDHEIELYNSSTGHIVAWANVPFLSSTTYTKLYMYYGNPYATNQQNPTAVWDTSHRLVLHLDEKESLHYDSTTNGNNGTPFGGIAQGISGKIDGTDSFDGLDDYIKVPHSNSITGFTTGFTASFWLKLDDTTRRQTILNKYNTIGNQRGWLIEFLTHATYGKVLSVLVSSDGAAFCQYYASFKPTAGEWYYITVVWESGKAAKFYVNGLQASTIGAGTVPSIFDNSGTPLDIGRSTYATDRYLKGALDEICLSDSARSANWILTSYYNQKDPPAFYTISGEEALPEEPDLTTPAPFNGATDVPASLSQLSFNITDYQGDLMNYTVTTYPDGGSENATNVGDGRYTIFISSLSRSTTYTWIVSVTDGTDWSNKTFTFTTESEIAWWDTNWQYRKTITIDPARVSSAQTSYAVLVEVTDSDLASKAQPDGADIVFTDYNNKQLSHEIEQYNASSGHLVAWVNLPLLSSTTYTRFYLYYGNSYATNQQNPEATWDSSHRMVLHLDERTGAHYDSTANVNNGTPFGGIAQGITGKIDGADNFDGVDDFIEVPHNNSITGFTTAFTVSFWLKLEDTVRQQTILGKYNTVGNQRAWVMEFQIDARYGKVLAFLISPDGVSFRKYFASFNPIAGEWYHIAAVWQSGEVPIFYVNGVKVSTIGIGTISSIFNNAGVPLNIGRCIYNSKRYLKGALDEIRISSTARSASWILTSYNNQGNAANFFEVGSEQRFPEGPIITSPFPLNGATRLPLQLNRLSFNLVNYNGGMMNYTAVTIPNIGSDSGNNVFDGRYSISISNLAPSTTYTWAVSVTDGTNWTNQTYSFTVSPGAPPTQDTPLLISSGGTNKTDERLVACNQTTYDPENDKITNIYNWYRNDTSVTNLLLPFNTNSSTIAKDYSGYSNNGVFVGGVTWTIDGKVGGAYKFDMGYIQIPGTSTLDGGGQWSEITVEQWIYLTTYRSGARTIAKIPSYEIGISWNKIFAGIWIDTGVRNVSGYNRVTYDTPLEKNTWYHVALTYKNGTGLTLYIDGIAVANKPVSGNIQTSGTEPIYLGWFDYFKGIIDETRIYPKSLSPQQVYQQYLETRDGLSNSSTIVPEETEVGDVWKCQVIPNDSYQDGVAKFSNTITIVENNPPTAYNVTIIPSAPHTNDNLEASYTYFDPDDDSESGTEVKWYRNGALQPELDNTLTVPHDLTTKGDIWYFTVRPNDGKEYGTIQTSQSVVIQNSPPIIDSFTPENTTLEINEGGIIQFTQISSDLDDDTLTYSWLLDGTEQSTAQNWTYQSTTPGIFNTTLVVSDGELLTTQQWNVTVNAPLSIAPYCPSDNPTIYEGSPKNSTLPTSTQMEIP